MSLASLFGVVKTQSGSATPEELTTRSGNHPFAHSVSRTGHKSGKTLAGTASNLCLGVRCSIWFGDVHSCLTRIRLATAAGSEPCFTLNYHLSTLNFLITTASGWLERF